LRVSNMNWCRVDRNGHLGCKWLYLSRFTWTKIGEWTRKEEKIAYTVTREFTNIDMKVAFGWGSVRNLRDAFFTWTRLSVRGQLKMCDRFFGHAFCDVFITYCIRHHESLCVVFVTLDDDVICLLITAIENSSVLL